MHVNRLVAGRHVTGNAISTRSAAAPPGAHFEAIKSLVGGRRLVCEPSILLGRPHPLSRRLSSLGFRLSYIWESLACLGRDVSPRPAWLCPGGRLPLSMDWPPLRSVGHAPRVLLKRVARIPRSPFALLASLMRSQDLPLNEKGRKCPFRSKTYGSSSSSISSSVDKKV